MKKILLISAVVLSLVGASGCSTNSASTSDNSTKSSKTVQKKHWDKKKDQKLAQEMKDYGKRIIKPILSMMVRLNLLIQLTEFTQMRLRKIFLS